MRRNTFKESHGFWKPKLTRILENDILYRPQVFI